MVSVLDQTALKDQRSVEARREQIYAMHLKGLSEREIAESVGVNQSTVSRALDINAGKNWEWFRQHWDHAGSQGSLVKEQKDRLMGVVHEAWTLYGKIDETDIARKMQALNLVRSTIKDLGQMLGLQLPSLSDPDNLYWLDQLEDTPDKEADTSAGRVNISGNASVPTIHLSNEAVVSGKA